MMRTTRIFYPDKITVNQALILPKQASVHISQVLRLKIDQPITVFNGDAYNYLTTISAVSKSNVTVQVLDKQVNTNESNINIHLAMALTKTAKMEIAIQKAVELGVAEITPVIMQHSVVKLDHKKKLKREQRWSDIIISACEQSGRSILPMLNPIIHFTQWDLGLLTGIKILCDPVSHYSLSHISKKPQKVVVLIGPEGGICEQEKHTCLHAGFIAVRFGQRILRAETAAIATLSAIQVLWGDFR